MGEPKKKRAVRIALPPCSVGLSLPLGNGPRFWLASRLCRFNGGGTFTGLGCTSIFDIAWIDTRTSVRERLSLVPPCGSSILLFLMLDQGVWADVKVGNEHLRLFAEHNAQGVQASVYNVISKTWIAPSEPVDDIEQGKERAAAHAQEYLQRAAGLELPSLLWKASRSA